MVTAVANYDKHSLSNLYYILESGNWKRVHILNVPEYTGLPMTLILLIKPEHIVTTSSELMFVPKEYEVSQLKHKMWQVGIKGAIDPDKIKKHTKKELTSEQIKN